MSWSWKIGRTAGIDVQVHYSLLLLLGWVTLTHYWAHGDLEEATRGLVFSVALFALVVLHEPGHALAARRYGIRTRDITLLPIGGVAELEGMPKDPKLELLVAPAGPAAHVVLAASLYAVLALGQGLTSAGGVLSVGGSFLDQLLWLNVSLAVFTCCQRSRWMAAGYCALLAMRLDRVRATQVAASMGQAMVLVLAVLGFFFNSFLILIALFVWFGAAQEASQVPMRSESAGGIGRH